MHRCQKSEWNKHDGRSLEFIQENCAENIDWGGLDTIKWLIETNSQRPTKRVSRPVLNAARTAELKANVEQTVFAEQFVEPAETVDLRAWDSSVKNQGSEGTCTAFAVVAAEEFLANKAGTPINLSERHLWYSYQRYNTVAALEAANRWWITTETIWPYSSPRPLRPVTANGHIADYEALTTLTEVNAALRAGLPLVLSVDTNSSWNNPYKGIINADGGPVVGGHAIAVSGFFTTTKGTYYILKNSWGRDFGDAGYAYLPARYCANYWCAFHVVKGGEFR